MENNSNGSNGDPWKVKVDVFRGYIKGKVDSIEKYMDDNTKNVAEIKKSIQNLNLALALHPQNCIQIEPIKEINLEIQKIKNIEVGRGAVKKLLFGFLSLLSGGLGALITLFLKWQF